MQKKKKKKELLDLSELPRNSGFLFVFSLLKLRFAYF